MHSGLVAPLVGAWIEIIISTEIPGCMKSLLSWERGLKYSKKDASTETINVAPLVGAWIEIDILFSSGSLQYRRSSRGSVD